MNKVRDDNFDIKLRNAEGVPILQLDGTVTKVALKAVKSTMDSLAKAGHYNVVLNLERAHLANLRFLAGLAGAVRTFQAHYGSVDLVMTRERLQQLSGAGQVARLFRPCVSDGQAISRIKRLRRQPEVITQANARILEKP